MAVVVGKVVGGDTVTVWGGEVLAIFVEVPAKTAI